MYKHKPILLILIWGLIVEIFVLIYYIFKRELSIEFYMDVFLIVFTTFGIYLVIKKIIKEVKK